MEGEQSGEDPPRLFPLKLASTLSTESWGNRESGGPSSNHSTETNVLICSFLIECSAAMRRGVPPRLASWPLASGRTGWNAYLRPSLFSGKRNGGELATCPGGMALERTLGEFSPEPILFQGEASPLLLR